MVSEEVSLGSLSDWADAIGRREEERLASSELADAGPTSAMSCTVNSFSSVCGADLGEARSRSRASRAWEARLCVEELDAFFVSSFLKSLTKREELFTEEFALSSLLR